MIKTFSSLRLLQFLSEKYELYTWKEKTLKFIVVCLAFNDWRDLGST